MMTSTSQVPSNQTVDAAISLFRPNVAFIVMSFIFCFMIIVLNFIEIHFKRKKWRGITRFEIILLNLAGADALTGLTTFSMIIADTVYFVRNFKSVEIFNAMKFFIIFSMSCSSEIVIVIGVERLSVLRRPLKHRVSNSSRKQMFKWMSILWFINVSIATLCVSLDRYFNKQVIKGSIGSIKVGFALGAYLLVGVFLIIVIYLQVATNVLRRTSVGEELDNRDTASATVAKRSTQKENAAVVACALVVIAYLVFNVPIAVELLQGKVQQAQFILMTLNSVENPMIYYFKTYIERYSIQQAGQQTSNAL